MKILVVGEKTSQVKTFATHLCGSFTSVKQTQYIYTYTGNWRAPDGQLHILRFLPLAGHITTLITNKGFDWNECSPLELVKNPKALKIKNIPKYVKILKANAADVDEIWLATDPDSEGDNIAYEVVQILKPLLKKQHIPLRRVWNSSLTHAEIYRAFTNLRQWADCLALAVQGRRYADAWLGFAGTREITLAARKVAKVKVLSVGRVQLPTLHLIVHRDFEHESFQSTDRWKIIANLQKESVLFSAEHIHGFFMDKNGAQQVLVKLQGAQSAKVISTNVKTHNLRPSIPLNTTAAVSLLSKLLKVTAKQALDIMVDLYTKELLSYPRTENAMFQKGFPHKKILTQINTLPMYSPFIQQIKNMQQVRSNGKKQETEDHDPIHPTGELKGLANLDAKTFRAWDILTRYYISLFMNDYRTEQLIAQLDIRSEPFVASGKTVLAVGWKAAQDWQKNDATAMPTLTKDEVVTVQNIHIKLSKTKPPIRYTDSQLLLAMEKATIGTKSSRPEIINKLVERKYIRRTQRKLISTLWGRSLIASLEPIWPEIVTPQFTRNVELLMEQVAKKEQSYTKMLENLRGEYLKYHAKLLSKLPEYQKLLRILNLTSQQANSAKIAPEINAILQELIKSSENFPIEFLPQTEEEKASELASIEQFIDDI